MRRLPSTREFALLAWDARLEVMATLRAIELGYLETKESRGDNDVRDTCTDRA